MNLSTIIVIALIVLAVAGACSLLARRKSASPCGGACFDCPPEGQVYQRHPPMIKLELPSGGDKVLLHACCAPCSSAIVECMVGNAIRPTIFYSNSNIFPEEEYLHRRNECIRYADEVGLDIIDDLYSHEDWMSYVRGLEAEPERGARCLECFKYRLLRAAQYATENGFNVLATTLASSRWKSLEQIDEAGQWACSQVEGVTWWGNNWRKGGLQERRNQLIKEKGFYNQLYCGCEFSMNRGK